MYSFTLPIRPPSNQGIGEIDGPPPSAQPFADIRDNRFPVASFDLREDSDVTYGTQIGVNRLPMHSFNLPIHPTSNEGIGEMDRLSLSEHSLSGTRDDDFPVAPLDLCGNSDLMYNPQFSVDRPQMCSFNPPMQPTSNEGMGEMVGPSFSEHSLAEIHDNSFPVAPLDLRGNSDVMYDTQIGVNQSQIFSFDPPTSNQGVSEMDGPLPSEHPFPRFNDNGLPLASLDPRKNSDATCGPQIGVVGSLVGCGALPFESTRADVQYRPHLHSFNSPIQPALTIIPHAPPPMQPGEESEPQDQPHQSSGEASPGLPAAMDEALDRPYLCDSCDKRFKQVQGLNRHKREEHKPSWCMFCDTKWGRPYLYREHLKRCHPNVHIDAVLGKPEGSYCRAAIMARDLQQQPKLPPGLAAVAKPV